MLKRNTLIEFGWAFKRWIPKLEGNLPEEKACVAQLKANYNNLKNKYDNLRAQSKSEIQDLFNFLNHLNF